MEIDSNKQIMLYVNESQAFSFHDFFLRIFMTLAVGVKIFKTLPDSPSIYECKIFVREQNLAFSKANVTFCHPIQAESPNPHPKNSSKGFISCLCIRTYTVNLDGKVPYFQ